MKITWIGQAGLVFEGGEGATVILDPYLSNSVERFEPHNYRRKPIDERFLSVNPDFLIFTHNHLDHYDPDTAPVYLGRDHHITVLAPRSAYNEARKNGGVHNYIQFDPETEWTEKGIRFTAVKAVHSDVYAIGVIIEELSTGERYYVTGDTLYNGGVFDSLPDDILAVFLPINGVGNNMNVSDAERFAERTGARYAVPIHFGMFDEIDPTEFGVKNRVIPEIYKEIRFK